MLKLLKLFYLVLFIVISITLSYGQMLQAISNDIHQSSGAVPTLVRWGGFSNTKAVLPLGTTVNTCPNQTICLPYTVAPLTGNALVACYTYSDSPASTPSLSDGVNTWVVDKVVDDTTNSKKVAIAHALNVSSATQLQIAFGANVTNVGALYKEYNNILSASAVDQSSSNTSASGSSTVTAGSQTPTAANDLLLQCSQRTQTPLTTSFTAGSQSNITWTLGITDVIDGLFSQWGQDSATVAINPTMTMANNSGYASVSLSLKTGTQGSPRPTGSMTPIGLLRADITDTIANTNPIVLQFPCDGANGITGDMSTGMQTGTSWRVTGITDSNSNTWTQIGSLLGNNNTGQTQHFYSQNPTCTNNMTVNVATTGLSDTVKDGTFYLYAWAGADTSSLFRQEYTSGGQLGNGSGGPFTWFDPASPGVANGCAVASLEEGFNTSVGITSPSGAVFTTQTFGGEDISGSHPPGENNHNSYFCFSNSNQQVWTSTFSGTSASNAAWRVSFFRGAGAADAATFSDTFTHANIASLNTLFYVTWFSSNQLKIASNKLTPTNLNLDAASIIVAPGPIFPNDQQAQITLATLTGGTAGSDIGSGLLLRAISANQTAYRAIVSHATGVNTFIEKFVSSGTATIISSSCSKSTPWTSGDILFFSVVGTALTIKSGGSGGTTVCSATDAAISSGVPGIAYSGILTGAEFTNFLAGPSGSF